MQRAGSQLLSRVSFSARGGAASACRIYRSERILGSLATQTQKVHDELPESERFSLVISFVLLSVCKAICNGNDRHFANY